MRVPREAGTPGKVETEQEKRNCKPFFWFQFSKRPGTRLHENPLIPHRKSPFDIRQLDKVSISYNQRNLGILHLKQKNLEHS